MATYISQYPPAQNDTYVKATTKYSTSFCPHFTTDPAKSLTGDQTNNQWVAAANTDQRFHIDLGGAKIIRRIYYENGHISGGITDYGAKLFTLQGSNDAGAFAELTYSVDTNWVYLTTAASQFDKHVALDQADPKYILVNNGAAYRYYALKISTNWGNVYMAIRRLVLQTEAGFGSGGSVAMLSDYGIL